MTPGSEETVTAPATGTTTPAADPTFAAALRAAVASSGLGLESIQRRLAARSVEVSVSTLSYWQTGARSPGRRRSEEVVAHLESVLGLEPRSLRVLIPPPRPRGHVQPTPLPQLPRAFQERAAVRRIAERVSHCRGQLLTRLSQSDVLTVGPDRRVRSLHGQMVMRADVCGIESIGLTQFFEDREAGTPQLDVITGGEVRARYTDPEHRVTATEVHFGHELQRGETVLLEFEVTSTGLGPADRTYDSSCGVGVRALALQVRFLEEDPPLWCESFQRVEQHGDEVRRRVAVDVSGHAHTIALECPSGTVGMAWDWA